MVRNCFFKFFNIVAFVQRNRSIMIIIVVFLIDKINLFSNVLFHFVETAGFNTVKLNAKNFTALEVLELFNKHITVLAPKEEQVKTLATKSAKKKK